MKAVSDPMPNANSLSNGGTGLSPVQSPGWGKIPRAAKSPFCKRGFRGISDFDKIPPILPLIKGGKYGLLRYIQNIAAIFLMPLVILTLSGCGKPPMLVHQYILEYPAPVVRGKAKSPEAIKVGLFSVAQTFNTNAMVYQPQPFKSETYNYSRWRANPGYLVTDYLLRDFRDSHLFTAVFGPGSNGRYRFFLEGGVVEFQEVDEPDGWKAALALTVTLLDVSQEETPQRVVFQKNFRAMEAMPEKTPQGLAQAMSRAMEHLSARIINDTYEAARQRAARK